MFYQPRKIKTPIKKLTKKNKNKKQYHVLQFFFGIFEDALVTPKREVCQGNIVAGSLGVDSLQKLQVWCVRNQRHVFK
jgi:hypothetical protein